MKETVIEVLSRPRLAQPVLIGGLPGMGYVGKLAAEHLVAEIKAKKFAELYSPHFPHQAVVEEGGLIRLPRNEFYWARVDGRSLVIWTGDAQSVTPEGHYEIVEKVLDFAEDLGVRQMFTLGGFATGKFSRAQPKVVAIGDLEMLRDLGPLGVSIEKRSGPIVGAVGLLVGLGKLRRMPGISLLGETHGMLVDHRAAQAVLQVVLKVLGLNISLENLQQRARETEQMIERVQRELMSREEMMKKREEEESWYIG
ncbi:MAG: proteasome assembly chaperone family protein [Candidatus Hadarchaeum sp.]|uniref:proteasome assembly chaperone family protein n=1 Tax=Candidatus Hadarchaeum sp. TaxID=2883567 RepID=UPI003D0CAB89